MKETTDVVYEKRLYLLRLFLIMVWLVLSSMSFLNANGIYSLIILVLMILVFFVGNLALPIAYPHPKEKLPIRTLGKREPLSSPEPQNDFLKEKL